MPDRRAISAFCLLVIIFPWCPSDQLRFDRRDITGETHSVPITDASTTYGCFELEIGTRHGQAVELLANLSRIPIEVQVGSCTTKPILSWDHCPIPYLECRANCEQRLTTTSSLLGSNHQRRLALYPYSREKCPRSPRIQHHRNL